MAPERKRDDCECTTYHVHLVVLLSMSLFSQVNTSTAETWPWLAYIPSLNCTGAIVHSRWLLTSSTCFNNKSVPPELLIQVQEIDSMGKVKGVRLVYVIDYTRDRGSKNGFTMLYLAQTSPSLTKNLVSLRTINANMNETSIVLSWDTGRANDARNVNVFALSVDVGPCIDDSIRHVCVSLKKHSASSSSLLGYCSHTSLGSPLVTIDANGLLSLAGVLRQRAGCHTQSNFVGTFSRIDHGRKWIKKKFRIQGMYEYILNT